MLRLILGRAGTGKTGMLLDELRARVAAKRPSGYLIVPEQYSHEAERELAGRCGDSASLYAEVLSFTRLAYRAALDAGGSARTYIDKGGRLLQLAVALDQIGGTLQVYGQAARSPELMALLLSSLDELRFGGADGAALREGIPTHSGDQPKASCMAPQMVLACMELFDRPNWQVMSTAKSTAIHRL